jgi:hypothetical protein
MERAGDEIVAAHPRNVQRVIDALAKRGVEVSDDTVRLKPKK